MDGTKWMIRTLALMKREKMDCEDVGEAAKGTGDRKLQFYANVQYSLELVILNPFSYTITFLKSFKSPKIDSIVFVVNLRKSIIF